MSEFETTAPLRSVLGDDIRSPRYIETVATVGYRWVCKLEISEEDLEVQVPAQEPNGLDGVGKKVESRKRLWGWALAGGGVLALCLAAIWCLHRPLSLPRVTGYTQITHDGHQKILVGTDGSRLYFNLMSGPISPQSIAQVAISGGGTAPIPVALPNPLLVDVSPNGSSFIIAADTGLWNVRILGGQARHLGDAYNASFSPDGNSVAYAGEGGGHIPRGERWDGNSQTGPCWRHRQRHRLVSGRRCDPVYHEGPDLGDVFERIGASRGDARLARLLH